jgi:hypothetical protein
VQSTTHGPMLAGLVEVEWLQVGALCQDSIHLGIRGAKLQPGAFFEEFHSGLGQQVPVGGRSS